MSQNSKNDTSRPPSQLTKNQKKKLKLKAKREMAKLGALAVKESGMHMNNAISHQSPPRSGGSKRNRKLKLYGKTQAGKNIENAISAEISDKQVARVMLSMALPADYFPVRFADEYSTAPTAIVSLPDTFDDSFGTTANANNTIPINLGMYFSFRSFERACVVLVRDETSTYNFMGRNPWIDTSKIPSASWDLSYSSTQMFPPGPGTSANSATNVYVPLVVPYAIVDAAVPGTKPHGSYWLGSTPDGDPAFEGRCYYVTKGTQFYLEMTTTGLVDNVDWTLLFDAYDSSGHYVDAFIAQTRTNNNNVTYTFPRDAIVCPKLQCSCTNFTSAGSVTLIVNKMQVKYVGVDVWGHRPAKNFAKNFASVGACRILAVSNYYQNTSNNFEKSGEIYQVQAPAGMTWWSFANGDAVKKLVSMGDYRVGKASKGGYSYLRPTSEVVFYPKNHFEVYNDVLVDSYYPFLNDRDNGDAYLVMITDIADNTAKKAVVTSTISIEYQTTDIWRGARPPLPSKGLYGTAVSELVKIPQHHENPLHFKQILGKVRSVIGSALNGILTYGPGALKLAERAAALV
jgi:hypothetical protein